MSKPSLLRTLQSRLDPLEPRVMLTGAADDSPGIGHPTVLSSNQAALLPELHEITGVDIAHQANLRGAGQTVVIIDSGVAYDHPALGNGYGTSYRVVGGWDFTEENDNDPYDDGPAGYHGTHVAGILAGQDAQHLGVAPEADIVALRVFNDYGRGKLSWLESSLQWVVENQNAFPHPITTVNMSIGTAWQDLGLPEYAELEDELQALRDANIFVSVAAGNRFDANDPDADHVGLSYPAASPYVVSAASSNTQGQLSQFSQRHPSSLVVPGEEVTSTVPDFLEDFNGKTDDYYAASGTSMAAPYLAGANMLVRQAMEQAGVQHITVDAIYDVLVDTADRHFDPATQQEYRYVNVGRAVTQILADDLAVKDATDTNTVSPSTGGPAVGPASPQGPVAPSAGTIPAPTDSPHAGPLVGPSVHVSAAPAVKPIAQATPASDVFQIDGNHVIVSGTSGDDEIHVDGAGFVRVNGQRFDFPLDEVAGITIRGGEGNDRLAFEVRHAHSEVTLQGNSIAWQAHGLSVDAFEFERTDVFAHAEGLAATFQGSDDRDRLVIQPDVSWMQSSHSANYVYAATQVTGFANDRRDSVTFYDTPGDDRAQVNPQLASLFADGFAATALGYSSYTLRATNGGFDTVAMVGTQGTDVVRAKPDFVTLHSRNYSVYAQGFESRSVAGQGGSDSARLHGSPREDQFIASATHDLLTTPTTKTDLQDFTRVDVFGNEGQDAVRYDGSETEDVFVAQPGLSSGIIAQALRTSDGFESVVIDAGAGNDSIWLYDSPGDDRFQLSASEVHAQGPGFRFHVRNVEFAHATSRQGDDQATLISERAADRIIAEADSISLQDDTGLAIAEGFAHAATTDEEDLLSMAGLDISDDAELDSLAAEWAWHSKTK